MKQSAIIAGTGFEGREKAIRSYCREGMSAILVREVLNSHDPNAIAVFLEVPVLFGVFRSRKKIGYIKAGTAKSLAAKMDKGCRFTAIVSSFWAPDDREHLRVTLEISEDDGISS